MKYRAISLLVFSTSVSDVYGYSKAKIPLPGGGSSVSSGKDEFPWIRPKHGRSMIAVPTLRGGAAVMALPPRVIVKPTVVTSIQKISFYSIATLLSAFFIYTNKSTLAKFLDKTFIQNTILELLRNANEQGPTGILLYMLGLALWESIGLSTVAVETAAGMAFGWSAIAASLIGKLLGASLAFAMGRGFLSSAVESKFGDNDTLMLVRHAVKIHPLRTAMLLKYSCFPETIKNYGSSLFMELRYWMFALATVVHSTPLTCVWTWLGMDSAKRLAVESLPVDQALRIALGACIFFGFVICPLLMAWWIRDMKQLSSL